MRSCVPVYYTKFCRSPLFAYSGRKNVILVPMDLTASSQITENEFQSMKALQKLNKTFATPIVFKATDFVPLELESHEISHLLEDFDTEVGKTVIVRFLFIIYISLQY